MSPDKNVELPSGFVQPNFLSEPLFESPATFEAASEEILPASTFAESPEVFSSNQPATHESNITAKEQLKYPEEPFYPKLEADSCLNSDGLPDIERQKKKFLYLCRHYIKRNRADLERLLDKFSSPKNDFFTSPASSQYHGAYDGGLCQHSIDVWEYAREMNNNTKLFPTKFSEESLCIASLFHDVCKVGLYKKVQRFRKDDKGRWETYEGFVIDEAFHFGGHGSKSVFMVQRSFQLTYEEAVAINCHMGFSDGSPAVVRDVSNAYHQYPLAWLIHVADEAATFLIDRSSPDKANK